MYCIIQVCTSIGPFFGFVIMLSFGFLEIFKIKEHPVLGFQKNIRVKWPLLCRYLSCGQTRLHKVGIYIWQYPLRGTPGSWLQPGESWKPYTHLAPLWLDHSKYERSGPVSVLPLKTDEVLWTKSELQLVWKLLHSFFVWGLSTMEFSRAQLAVANLYSNLVLNLTLEWQEWVPSMVMLPFMLLL